jgi:lipopolysaccharide heptosyltransferase II
MNIKSNLNKILVINLGGIGDVVLSLPALQTLRRGYPQSKIYCLVIKDCEEILLRYKFLDKIYSYASLKEFFKILFFLRKEKFDLVINLRTLASKIGALKMRFIISFIRPIYKIGRDTEGRGYFWDLKLMEKNIATMHDRDYDLALIRLLGINSEEKEIILEIETKDRFYISCFLRQHGILPQDLLIGIHAGARWQSRCWPIENFLRLTESLIKKYNPKFVLIGSNKEKKIFKKFKRRYSDRLVSAIGKTDFGKLLALIERCDLLITNNSGPMHLAAILKRPLIAIFAGDIKRFSPLGEAKNTIVLYKKQECSPCLLRYCFSRKCLRDISVEEVLEAVSKLINKK